MKSAPTKTGAWTEEEDILLVEYQAVYGNKWSQISKHIPGRNGQSCAQRWRHKVNPNITREKWTPEEDSRLTRFVQEIGVGKWATVARHLPGRTDQQCMGRWRRHLDPNIRKDAWTAEEDARLYALYQEYGSSWSMIAKCIANRTPQQCRGRWCILTSSKSKASLPAAPETPHQEHATHGQGSQATDTETTRRGRVQPHDCPSTVIGDATTEMPAMPASALLLTQGGGEFLQPPTVQQTRLARLRVRNTMVGIDVSGIGGLLRQDRRPAVLQDPGSVGALMYAGKAKSQSQTGVDQQDDLVGVDSTQRGRLLLGTRVLSFRRRLRSTQRRPRGRLTAVILPSSGGTPKGRASKPEPLASIAVATVAAVDPLLSPGHHSPVITDDVIVGEHVPFRPSTNPCGAKECRGKDYDGQGVDSGNTDGRAPHPCRASKGAGTNAVVSTCERPTVSTGSRRGLASTGCRRQRPAGRSEEAPSGDAVLHMSSRKTRSGRCYPLATMPAIMSATLSLQRKADDGGPGARAYTEAPGNAADTTGGCIGGLDGALAASVNSLAEMKEQQERADVDTFRLPGGLAGEAGVSIPGYVFTAQASNGGPTIAAGFRQQAIAGGSADTSLGLPGELFGEGGTPPRGDQLLDWQEVIGSPPTSSFLAFVEAGLLQTPTGALGPSPGPELLCAPVPPGMPKVTPGFSNDWSDVPALSWTELQACHPSFGIIARPPTSSAQGTPDNSRPALRPVPDNCRVGTTPRRDMYVRSTGQGGEPSSTPAAVRYPSSPMVHLGESSTEDEGQGDTLSMPPSPCGPNQGPKQLNGCRTDRTACGHSRQARAGTAAPDLPPSRHKAQTSAANGKGDCTIPDFCSPADKHHMAISGSQLKSQERVQGLPTHPPTAYHGTGFASNRLMADQLEQLKPATLMADHTTAPTLASVPPCPVVAMDGTSPHLYLGVQLSIARPSLTPGQLPLPPALASALMPAMIQQAHKPSSVCVGKLQPRPPVANQELPGLAAPGGSTGGVSYVSAPGSRSVLVAPTTALGLGSTGQGAVFPRLILPKQPAAGTMRSLFPVLSLNTHQDCNQNVTS